jgi:aminomethyltransferase
MKGKTYLKVTPLHDLHKEAGARMVDFNGWEMPLYYTSIIEEHNVVRESVGLFDVSHMGEIDIEGPDAQETIQRLTTNDIKRLKEGMIQYSVMCNNNGGIIDDLLVYMLAQDHYMLCVNASNTEKDFNWIQENKVRDTRIRDISRDISQIAIQGGNSEKILQILTDIDLSVIKYYRFRKGKIDGIDAIISRTGYTGEDGFEIYLDNTYSIRLWKSLLHVGAGFGIKPIGLGARDTLRIEMKYPLYGNDISEIISPIEAGMEWIVKLDKGDFIGKDAILREMKEGVKRRLVGFMMLEKGIARPHYKIYHKEIEIGEVTSGTFSPSLNKAIGIGYINADYSGIREEIEVKIRGKRIKGEIVSTPFYPSQVRCN